MTGAPNDKYQLNKALTPHYVDNHLCAVDSFRQRFRCQKVNQYDKSTTPTDIYTRYFARYTMNKSFCSHY